MMLEPTITIGNIIEAFGFVGGIGVILIRQNVNSDFMRKQISEMKTDLKGLAAVITAMAVTDNRLTNLEQDFRDLRKGRGFISEELNGEYSRHSKT